MAAFIIVALIWFAGDAGTALYFLVTGKTYTAPKGSLWLAFFIRSGFAFWGLSLL